MHMQQMADSDGTFGDFTHATDCACRKCKAKKVRYRIWEFSFVWGRVGRGDQNDS